MSNDPVKNPGDKLRVQLVSWTKDPIHTLYAAWQASKTDDPLLTLDGINYLTRLWDLKNHKHVPGEADPVFPTDIDRAINPKELDDLFWKIIDMDIPIGRFVNMTFTFEGMHIALREQFVREKMGWEFWLQSGRIRDQSTFFDDGWYHVPESIIAAQERWLRESEEHLKRLERDNPVMAAHHRVQTAAELEDGIVPQGPLDVFLGNLKSQQESYKALVTDFKVPHEDARELIGLALTHKGGASTNITGLRHTISKRSCQILQLGNWEPFVMGLIEETATKIHPGFRTLASPPCMKGDTFMGCPYNLDNERRVSGEDKLAPCSLWMTKVYVPRKYPPGAIRPDIGGREQDEVIASLDWGSINSTKPSPEYGVTTVAKYEKFWGRDPWSGKIKLKVVT
jgi:hypothetical protein